MDAAALHPLRDLAARFCGLPDEDAVFAALVARGATITGAGKELMRICAPGGEADRLAATLEDPEAAARYVREIAEAFAPFADVLPALEVTGGGECWMSYSKSYIRTTPEEARRRHGY